MSADGQFDVADDLGNLEGAGGVSCVVASENEGHEKSITVITKRNKSIKL